MKCTECCYYWQDEDESRPRCHWEARCSGDMTTANRMTKSDSTLTRVATPGTAEAVPFSAARGRPSRADFALHP